MLKSILVIGPVVINSFSFAQLNRGSNQEIEIQENGNLIKGLKRGVITTDEGIIIEADQFEYEKSLNILNASGNVKLTDKIKDYEISSEEITYFKNTDNIITKGKTNFLIKKKYDIKSKDVFYSANDKLVSSNYKTKIRDNNSNFYELDKIKSYLLSIQN